MDSANFPNPRIIITPNGQAPILGDLLFPGKVQFTEVNLFGPDASNGIFIPQRPSDVSWGIERSSHFSTLPLTVIINSNISDDTGFKVSENLSSTRCYLEKCAVIMGLEISHLNLDRLEKIARIKSIPEAIQLLYKGRAVGAKSLDISFRDFQLRKNKDVFNYFKILASTPDTNTLDVECMKMIMQAGPNVAVKHHKLFTRKSIMYIENGGSFMSSTAVSKAEARYIPQYFHTRKGRYSLTLSKIREFYERCQDNPPESDFYRQTLWAFYLCKLLF
jgi:hypothetical protein